MWGLKGVEHFLRELDAGFPAHAGVGSGSVTLAVVC